MAKYKKCERCELNYIPVEEDYCLVCKQELKLEQAEEDIDLEICPICGVNYMPINQAMCDECSNTPTAEILDDEEEIIEPEEKEEVIWIEPEVVDIDSDVEIVSLSELEDEDDVDDSFDDDDDDDADIFEKAVSTDKFEDDFDYVDPDDFDDALDDDDDEDEEEDDDYE